MELTRSPDQHIELRDHLERIEGDRATDIALGARLRDVASTRHCPHCGAGGAVNHGFDKHGRQRFKCRKKSFGGCDRTFNLLTGTPLARMRKPERWHAFSKALADGFISVDRLHESGLGISRLTVWRWRNRFLAAQTARQAARLGGVVEADETYFKTSFKGSRGWKRGNPPANRPPRYRGAPAIKRGLSDEQVPILTAVDSNGSIFKATINGLSAIRPTLRGIIELGSIICSDGIRTYVKLAADTDSEHRLIPTPGRKTKAQKLRGGKPRQTGRLALGCVNSHHERMKTFVNRLARGTSTANLMTYLGWLRTVGRAGFGSETLMREALGLE
jgi:transposase-like protein